MRCAVHPEVETELRCASCGTPICPDCLVETPVGMKCRTCGLAPPPPIYRLTPAGLAAGLATAAAGGLTTGVLALVLWAQVGMWVLLLAPAAGRLVGDGVIRAAGGKRGPIVAAGGAAACAIGVLLLGPDLVRILLHAPLLGPADLVRGLVVQPQLLVLAALSALFTYWRIR